MALFNTTSRREQGGLHTRQPICLMVHGAGPGQLPACGLAMARVPIRHTTDAAAHLGCPAVTKTDASFRNGPRGDC